jgi:hypothetical protein
MSGGGIIMEGRSLVSIPVIGSIIPLYETSEEWIRFFFLDRIYRIDGIVFAFGEEPFRPKAVLSR